MNSSLLVDNAITQLVHTASRRNARRGAPNCAAFADAAQPDHERVRVNFLSHPRQRVVTWLGKRIAPGIQIGATDCRARSRCSPKARDAISLQLLAASPRECTFSPPVPYCETCNCVCNEPGCRCVLYTRVRVCCRVQARQLCAASHRPQQLVALRPRACSNALRGTAPDVPAERSRVVASSIPPDVPAERPLCRVVTCNSVPCGNTAHVHDAACPFHAGLLSCWSAAAITPIAVARTSVL